ncbi:Holliday junction branch migration protein RuvA, partial [bacterium]|nr:Holliday junction branch migration protein RuvA [bacterium]
LHVSGVGPKTALNIMSRMSLDILIQAIADRNITLLSKCQGLGKKTAEKLVLELSDKVGGKSAIKKNSIEDLCICSSNSSISDAVSALVSLGYRTNDADKAVQKAVEKIGGDASTEELLKFALKA